MRWGFGAADSGSAGVFGGTGGDSLATMQLNPAALTRLESNEWTLSGRALIGQGEFRRDGESSSLANEVGVFPEAAVAWKLPERPLWVGFSLAPVAALQAEWNFEDVPAEGSGVFYPDVGQESGFLAIKANAALAWKINDHWSVGGSVGAIYSRVIFDAPFIFQTNPDLAGAKTDLDLETDGWAFTWDVGAVYQPTPDWTFAARFRPKVDLSNQGDARADFSAELPGLAGAIANYEAASRNVLPLTIGAGFSWDVTEKWKVGGWAEWFRWSSAFDRFGIELSNSSNAGVSAELGTDSPSDQVPLEWEDRLVLALGVEYQLNSAWTARGGWRYGRSPIPTELVTPLNASITEHAVTVGLGWRGEDWRVDASYQIEFGARQDIDVSGFQALEFSNSSVDLTVHGFGIGVAREF